MASLKEIFKQFTISIWALSIPFDIILGLRFDVFPPTEAGGMAVLLCLFIGLFTYKELKIKHIPEIIFDTVLGQGL